MLESLDRTAAHTMEWAIIEGKLKLGIGGVEWLAIHVNPDELRKKHLSNWFGFLADVERKNSDELMQDALLMDSDSFYSRHALNWWIVVKNALTYLSLLRQRDYNRYSDFIRELQLKGGMS
ncbi:hypothetical protein [Paenibacillus zanthoxyli]|uniref:hypothetical protein n=1 Tax=Paenibacillus zanthoxyli TaxID=369399 RepID=UPI00046FB08A|nr:hypothetical protein [Paenibacillus zanthoxyli]